MDAHNTIVHGINELTMDCHGVAVGDLRRSLRQILNVGDEAVAIVGGREVEDSFVLAPGARLDFTKVSGRKGLGRLLTLKELIEVWEISPAQYEELVGLGLPFVKLDGEVLHPEITVDEFFRTLRLKDAVGAQTPEARGSEGHWPTIGPRPNTVEYQGRRARMGRKTFDLLRMLVEAVGKPVDFAEIGDVVYGQSTTESNTIHGLRRELRKQLRQHGLEDLAEAICTPPGRTEQFFIDYELLSTTRSSSP